MDLRRLAVLTAMFLLTPLPAAAAATRDDAPQAVDVFGSLITGAGLTNSSPTAVAGLTEVVAVEASNSTYYALEANGTVWAWGSGAQGQLGNGTTPVMQQTPVPVSFPPGIEIVAIGEAGSDAMAVDSEGHGWVWGRGNEGSLCGATRIDAPEEIPGMSGLVAVQGGGPHALWLTSAGTVYGCGKNGAGQLALPPSVAEAATPTLLPLKEVVQISAGPTVSMVRTASGEVLTFGDNLVGQIGDGKDSEAVYTPYRVPLPEPAIDISAGGDRPTNGSMLAVTASGRLFGWGDDEDGELGNGREQRAVRSPIDTGLRFQAAVTGDLFSLGLTAEGTLLSWGAASEALSGGRQALGQLGNGFGQGVQLTPEVVDEDVSQVATTAGASIDLHD
ncbi:MAG TPA: hypothetical protein VMF09_12730 [Solirubrobacteraceae bacterium]|nr:hypothetical protein [Solirubrobacteraceae bacterium]